MTDNEEIFKSTKMLVQLFDYLHKFLELKLRKWIVLLGKS